LPVLLDKPEIFCVKPSKLFINGADLQNAS
jgi:hypothetical protein